MSDKQKLNEIAFNCKLANAIAVTLNKQLRDFLPGLADKVSNDNAGTLGDKTKLLNNLIDQIGVITEVEQLTDLIQTAIN